MEKEIIIAGAGSAGLSAALFLAEQGYKPRIIEKRSAPSTITKALGINPRTLHILKDSGVTQRFLDTGWKCSAMNFWYNHKPFARNDFSKVKTEYPFMLIQPQYETEKILEEALALRGVFVERGQEVETVAAGDVTSTLTLKNSLGERTQLTTSGIVIGADGSRSSVRESLSIPFNGWEHREEFRLFDVELETPLTGTEGHYLLFREGAMIMLRIKDNIWRVGGNVPHAMEYLPAGTRTGKVLWETTFTVRENVAAAFRKNNVFLVGDAAHIHSPLGAKGMNLCIEDGYILASLIAQGREETFDRVRRGEIARTVGIIGQLTSLAGGRGPVGKFVRSSMPYLSPLFPVVMPLTRKFLLGLK